LNVGVAVDAGLGIARFSLAFWPFWDFANTVVLAILFVSKI